MRRTVALVACVLAALLPTTASALSVNEVARELRCITCSTTLDISTAPSALRMKDTIAEKIQAGWTKGQILDFMEREFGREVLATPPKSGFDLAAWVVPPLLVLGGLIAIVVVARTSRREHGAEQVPDLADITREEAERLERAVAEETGATEA